MGSSPSKLEKALGQMFPESERFYGLENVGNICWCNSVLQALFFCSPFRERVLQHAAAAGKGGSGGKRGAAAAAAGGEHLLSVLGELFSSIQGQKKRTGSLPPKKFVTRLREENELFRAPVHHDAHEFLNFVLNSIDESLRAAAGSSDGSSATTWVEEIFGGLLTNETKCLNCDTVTSREEKFLDLSLDVEQNTSVTACMRSFGSVETLRGEDKFFCDSCCSYQEAQKSMKVLRLPNVMALHLKRFKYMEQLQRFKKLSYRIVFPFELKVPNTASATPAPDSTYDLFAVVVHLGSGPNHGHYIAMVKSNDHWLLFDDDAVELIDEARVRRVFGLSHDEQLSTETGYILFYTRRS